MMYSAKKPHSIAEELILPASIDMVSAVIDGNTAAKLQAIPLSRRRINDITNNLKKQLIEKIKDNLRLTAIKATG